MAGGGTNTSTSYTIPQNQYINDFVNQTVGMLGRTQQDAPLYQFAQPQQREIAGMSPLQQYAGGMVGRIGQGNPYSQGALGLLGYQAPQAPPQNFGQGQLGQMGGPSQSQSFERGGGDEWGMGGNPPAGPQTDPNSALGQLQQLTSGPIGSSPATRAGMAAFQQNVLPTLQNELGAMGLGRSGIAGEQIQRASTSAAVPLIQQEIANREQGIGQYGSLAQQLGGLGQQDVQNWTTAAGLGSSLGGTQQQTAQAALDSPYQDWLRRQALAQSSAGLGGIPYQAPMQSTTQTPSPGFFGK